MGSVPINKCSFAVQENQDSIRSNWILVNGYIRNFWICETVCPGSRLFRCFRYLSCLLSGKVYNSKFEFQTSHSKIDSRKFTRTMNGYQTIRYCALAKNGIDFLQAFTFQEMSRLKSFNRSSEVNCLLILVTGLME